MKLHVATLGAAFTNGRRLFEIPGAFTEAEILQSQRTRRTDVRIVSGVIRLQRTTVNRRDLGVVAPLNGDHFVDASNFGTEADAARAVNAAVHVLLNHWTHVEIHVSTALFGIAGVSVAVFEREVLKSHSPDLSQIGQSRG